MEGKERKTGRWDDETYVGGGEHKLVEDDPFGLSLESTSLVKLDDLSKHEKEEKG